jgi:hypothetical protein
MKIPNKLPRTVVDLCNHPEVQRIVMQTFATAYGLHLLDCDDQTDVDAEQVWLTFLNALGEGWSQLDDELFKRSNYSLKF